MKEIIIIILSLITSLPLLHAQTQPNKNLAEAVKTEYGFELPFSRKSKRTIPEIRLKRINSKDIQLYKIYDTAGKRTRQSLDADMFFSFKINGTDLWICGVFMYEGPNPCTDALLLVDSKGSVWDILYATVESEFLTARQFSISTDYEICIFTIEPSKVESIELWDDDCEFTGYRQDCVYRVQDKKFVLVSTKRGPDRLIKSSDFKPGQLYLWDPFWAI